VQIYNPTHNIYYKQAFVFFHNLLNNYFYMETATILSIFISGLLLGITGYSVYTSFGPVSKELRDPFEEHED
jgi:PsbN protein